MTEDSGARRKCITLSENGSQQRNTNLSPESLTLRQIEDGVPYLDNGELMRLAHTVDDEIEMRLMFCEDTSTRQK